MDILEDISQTIIKASTSLSKDKSNALEKAIEIEDNENAKLSRFMKIIRLPKRPDFRYVTILEFLM